MIDWGLVLAMATCPVPQVADLSVRPISDDGHRVVLRARADVARGNIGSIEIWFGDRSALIAHVFARGHLAMSFKHRYRRPGSYRISVTAESTTSSCRRFKTSPPATLRIRVPVTPRSYPSSL